MNTCTQICPGCHAHESIEKEECNGFVIRECINCGLNFSDPMKAGSNYWYDKTYYIRHSAIDNRIRSYYVWARNRISQRKNIVLIDIGCGEGTFVNYLRKKDIEAYGVDFSVEAIQLGKEWFGTEYISTSTVEDVKIKNNISGFDVITFFEVLEHVDNVDEFLQMVHSNLKEGGLVFATVPNKYRWPIIEFNDYPPHHLTRWTREALIQVFSRNGFEVIEVTPTSGFRSYWTFVSYIFRALLYKTLSGRKQIYKDKNAKGHTYSRFYKKILSRLYLRHIRDTIALIIALPTYPLVFPFFKGYNLQVHAEKK